MPKMFIGVSKNVGAVFVCFHNFFLKQNCLCPVCYVLQHFYFSFLVTIHYAPLCDKQILY